MEADLSNDGYISRTFGSAGAEQYITHLLGGIEYKSLQPTTFPQWPGAFFITTPAIHHATPSTHINGRPAWLLDYQICPSGTVVPQFIWRPNNPSDARRYTNATLHMPIFFVHTNRVNLGLNLIHAAAGDSGMLLGARISAPVGTCSTTYVRIKWPGYDDWYRQIMTRDQTPAHTTISLEKLARRVANAVCLFLDEAAQMNGQDPAWRVGGNTGIWKGDVNLIGLIQVSQSSWQPILQLNRFIISRNAFLPNLPGAQTLRAPISTSYASVPKYDTQTDSSFRLHPPISKSYASVPKHDTRTDSDFKLHLDKGMDPYITANEAYAHARRMKTQLKAVFATIGFSDEPEYVLQVGFNETALREGLLVEEIYLSVNGDLPSFNNQIFNAFASAFTPFPGVVYTRERTDHLPVDPPAHKFRHLSSLGGFKVRTASPSTSTGTGGKDTIGRDESGKGDSSGKGKSKEDRPGAGGGNDSEKNEGGDNDNDNDDDDGGDDPDPEEPSGGGSSSLKPGGFHITLKSTVSIKSEGMVSHDVTTCVTAVIKVDTHVEGSWPAPKIGVDMAAIEMSCETHQDPRGHWQPAYTLLQADVQMTACSAQKIVLASYTPLAVHVDGDSKKKTTKESLSSSVGASLPLAAPHKPTIEAGITVGGTQTEGVAGRWGIHPRGLASTHRPAHLMDETYHFVDGKYWQYIPNDADFDNVETATFVGSNSPSGVFHRKERAPTKVEIKVISFWETKPRSTDRWNALFNLKTNLWGLLPGSAKKIPAFANFIYGVSTIVHLRQKAPDKEMPILLQGDFQVEELTEDRQPFSEADKVPEYGNLEVPMDVAIMGIASLDKTAQGRHNQGNILL